MVQLLLSKENIGPNIIYHYYEFIMVEDGFSHDKSIMKITPLQYAIMKENIAIIHALLKCKKMI